MRGAWIANLAVAIVALAALCEPTFAEPKKPTRAEIEAARGHFERAEAAKARGEYRAAALAYVDAYEVLPDAEFLFNAGEMYRLAGDTEQAITYFETYLEMDPDGRGADEARAALKTLRERQEPAATEPAVAPAPPPPEAATTPSASIAAIETAPPAANAGRSWRIAGLGTAGAGLALVGAGVYFGLKAKSLGDEAATWDRYMPDKVAEGESAETWAIVATSLGTAAIIGGGVLYYLGLRQRVEKVPPPGAQVAVMATQTAVGLQVGGTF